MYPNLFRTVFLKNLSRFLLVTQFGLLLNMNFTMFKGKGNVLFPGWHATGNQEHHVLSQVVRCLMMMKISNV